MKKEKEIDYSDIPATNENFWRNATVHNPKLQNDLMLRARAEVTKWLKKILRQP